MQKNKYRVRFSINTADGQPIHTIKAMYEWTDKERDMVDRIISGILDYAILPPEGGEEDG